MGGCQNHGPSLGTLNIRCHTIVGIQEGTIILTTNRGVYSRRAILIIHTLKQFKNNEASRQSQPGPETEHGEKGSMLTERDKKGFRV